jgi:hypothetical protein
LAKSLGRECGELERVHDDDLTVDREGWIQVAVGRPEFGAEDERNGGPGAALVQMDFEPTHQGP